ncbi:MAG: SAM-dependent methyltransferase [Tannerellaceae bacterium]|jgi:predicted O-methyltransferase YrrM|nr:SAM-dependent methyltransferase [Tannerellaceae bacterium]
MLLYRKIRYRKGYGVHSPFVYDFITKVVEERSPYYCFHDIELIRKRLFGDKTVAQVVRKKAIDPKRGALLFRTAHYFKARNIVQIGSCMGLSTLYLTSYAAGLRCVSLESVPSYASISRWVYDEAARTPVDLRVGDCKALLPDVLIDLARLDLVYVHPLFEQHDMDWLFNACLKHVHTGTICIFDGIKATGAMRRFWKTVCAHPDVTVTIDLYSMGIVFFDKKLHKRDYTVYF